MSSVIKSEIILTYFIKETNESEIKIARAIVLIAELLNFGFNWFQEDIRKMMQKGEKDFFA